MTIGLVLISLMMGGIVWWLFRQTINVQPWVAQSVVAQAGADSVPSPQARVALWVFLGVVTSLFALFVSAYAMRLGGFSDWQPLPRPRFLAVNTAVLVGASLAMQWTVVAVRRGDSRSVGRGLAASGLLTLGFVAGQLFVWTQLRAAGYFASTSAATAFFYLFTAVHGAHVLGGLVAWVRATTRAWREPGAPGLRLIIELCATYWHYLLAVWLVLYALLVSGELGLAICSSTPL